MKILYTTNNPLSTDNKTIIFNRNYPISKDAITQLITILLLLIPTLSFCQDIVYPACPKEIVTESHFSKSIDDEYRWLENPEDKRLDAWLEGQKKLTDKALAKIAFHQNAYKAIDRYSYVKYDNPQKDGEYYFTYAYFNDVGAPALFYQKLLNDNPSILVDPRFISSKDNISINNYSVSGNSKLLAYQFSRNGSDWQEIKVVNLRTGHHLEDHLKHVKFSNISWKDDGFYYSRYPDQGMKSTQGQEVYYHKIGQPQSEDKLIFRRKKNPTAYFNAFTTEDERYLFIKETDEEKGIWNIFYIDFTAENPALRPLITRLSGDEHLTILGNNNDSIFATSFKDNNNGMIIRINPQKPREWKIVVPEFSTALLLNAILLKDRIIALYLSNRKEQIIFYDLNGKLLEAIQLPFGFNANGFNCNKDDKELLFSYSGYTQPKAVYRLSTEDFSMKPLRATTVNFDYTNFATKELEYTSFDGTKVPLFIIYHKKTDLHANNPLLLKAYGGFGSISMPSFNPGIVHFLTQGGIFAFANIRGGGDKGKAWALDGRGINKQNSFKDFIAAAEFLIDSNYTSPEKLAISGASNGGLVVGAAMTMRPELFKVAVPIVAPMDMLRFENFTIGHLHTDEYGSTQDSAGFYNLLSYSPLHNIKKEINYPATLIMTSDNDDRVPPLHSYKFAAKLQNRKAQKNPVLLHVETSAGHYGAQSSFKKRISEQADMYNFILYYLTEEQ